MAELHDFAEDPGTPAEHDLARRIAETLEKHYPVAGGSLMGHGWTVHVSIPQGVATIRNLRLAAMFPHLREMGYVLKLVELVDDAEMKCVMRAGGELLEAFNVERGRYSPDAYAAASPKAGADAFDFRKGWKSRTLREATPDDLRKLGAI